MYLAGHEHSLQHIYPDSAIHYFISGAASEITPAKMLSESKFAASEYGFMSFSLSADRAIVQAIDDRGRLLYQTSIAK